MTTSGRDRFTGQPVRSCTSRPTCALDLGRGSGKALVGAPRHHAKRRRRPAADAFERRPPRSRRDRAPHGGRRAKLPMPGSRARRAPISGQSPGSSNVTTMRPMSARTPDTRRSPSDGLDAPHQRADEPRPVPALERELPVVDDDRGHPADYGRSDSQRATAAAARSPLTHGALRSWPAGRCRSSPPPGRIPARRSPVPGRARLPGREGERRAALAHDDGAPDPAAAARGHGRRELRDRDGAMTSRCRRRQLVGPAGNQRQVPRGTLENRALVEHPVHRTADQSHERPGQRRAVEPEVDGDDRCGRPGAGVRQQRARGAGAGGVPQTARVRATGRRPPPHPRRSAGIRTKTMRARPSASIPMRGRHAERARCRPRARCGGPPARRTARRGARAPARRRRPRARGPNSSATTRTKTGRGGHVGRLVEGRVRQRCQSHSQRRGVCPCCLSQSLTVNVAGTAAAAAAGAVVPRAAAAVRPDAITASRSRQERARQPSTPASRCQGGGSRRARAGGRPGRSGRPSSATGPAAAGPARTVPRRVEQRIGRPVAAEEHVLAVVDPLAGHAVDECGGAAAAARCAVDDGDRTPASASRTAAVRPAHPAPSTTTWGRAAAVNGCATRSAAPAAPGPDAGRERRA